MAHLDSYSGFIFDFGGVLVYPQAPEHEELMAAVLGISRQEFAELYWDQRLEYDRGSLTGDEYWTKLAARTGTVTPNGAIQKLIDIDTKSWMRFDEPMWDWVQDLKSAGKRVAILSNMPQELGHALRTSTDRLQCFDQVTLSYEVHTVKPERAIYEHCLQGLNTPASRTLFLDDRMANVRAAEMLGIQAMQFLDSTGFLKDFRA